MQVSKDNTGVDHSVKFTVCAELPSVAVTEPVASAAIVPILALNVPEAFPAVITILVGTVISLELDANVIAVLVRAGWERVAVHTLVTPDSTPFGLHTSEVKTTWALKEIVTDCDEPL